MSKSLYIAEKPSVAQEFAKVLKLNTARKNGYLESDNAIVTWCVGHLVTMSYPDKYDEKYKRWSLDTIPFIPDQFKYEVIEQVKNQFDIVSSLLNREDVDTIYVCTDAGREGEYIYRLVEQQANVSGKIRKRVWIDSQTEEEILRGIREAKDLSCYDTLASAAYLRAKEDYLMGINFSRALTLKYGYAVKNLLNTDKGAISVGRVMTCVLGMVVNREREIRNFVKNSFYRIVLSAGLQDSFLEAEWKAVPESRYYQYPGLYKDNGFQKEEDARRFVEELKNVLPYEAKVLSVEKKKETKNAPLLYNLAELQNDCSKFFKISPDETLRIAQELYEKKLTTYPRTDARVLSSAVAKVIGQNLKGISNLPDYREYCLDIQQSGSYKNIIKSRYVNDKQVTDHYAIIPTGQGFNSIQGLSANSAKVYECIVRRFLSIFYPPAVYRKIALTLGLSNENFFANFKVLEEEGYLKVLQYSFGKKKEKDESGEESTDASMAMLVSELKKGAVLEIKDLQIKEGETAPPKRYNSGNIILAMENAGQLIEDEELRAQIKGSGIGTSATRAEILKKLFTIHYLNLNNKTQIISPTIQGELIYEVVNRSIKALLVPELTASWEKGLTGVAAGDIAESEYMEKLDAFVRKKTEMVKGLNNQYELNAIYHNISLFYSKNTK